MYLVVKNFGPIKEARIDLNKKFYLFMGENNSGKTYLTKLLYVIFDKDVISSFSSNSEYNKFSYTENFTLDSYIISSILSSFSLYLKNVAIKKSIGLSVSDDFDLSFDFDLDNVSKKALKSDSHVGFSDSETEPLKIFSLLKPENSLNVEVKTYSLEDIEKKLPADFYDNVPKNKFRSTIESIKRDVGESLCQSTLTLLLQIKENAFFFPYNRVSILENYEYYKEKEHIKRKEFAEKLLNLIDSSENESGKRSVFNTSSYNDSLSYISSIIAKMRSVKESSSSDSVSNGSGLYEDLLAILSKMMGGEIIFDKTSYLNQYKEKYQMTDGTVCDLDLASSSVNSMSLLYIYLKFWAKDSDNFLMIDEPEMNLHLANQALLMKLFVDFSVNNRVLIATHSPIVAEILNINILNQNSENKIESEYINQDFDADNAVVYYFSNGGVKSYSIGDYGVTFKDFNDSRSLIYSLADELSESIFNSKLED